MPFPREVPSRPENTASRVAHLNIARKTSQPRVAQAPARSVRSASMCQRSQRSSQFSQTVPFTTRTVSQSVERRAREQKPWDSTITNLRRYKLNPSGELLRRMNRISKHREDAAANLKERLQEMQRDVRPFLAKRQPQQPTSAFASKVSTGRQPPRKTRSNAELDLNNSELDRAVRKATSLRDLATSLSELDGLPTEDSLCSNQSDFAWGDVQEVEDDITRLQHVLSRLGHGSSGSELEGLNVRPSTLTRTDAVSQRSPMSTSTKQSFRPSARSPKKDDHMDRIIASVATPQRRSPHYRGPSPLRHDPYLTAARQVRASPAVRDTKPPRQVRCSSPAVRCSSPAVRDLKPARSKGSVSTRASPRPVKRAWDCPNSFSDASSGNQQERSVEKDNEPRASTPSFGIASEDCDEYTRCRSASLEQETITSIPPLPTFRPYNYSRDPQVPLHTDSSRNRYSEPAYNHTMDGRTTTYVDQENVPSLSLEKLFANDKRTDRSRRTYANAEAMERHGLRYDETFSGPLSDLINRQADDLRHIFG